MNNRGRGKKSIIDKIRMVERGRGDGVGREGEMINEERKGEEIMAKMGEKKDNKKKKARKQDDNNKETFPDSIGFFTL
jgi:recombinational DNA repair ATPase RecF